jgi:hypothetical protein
MIDHWIDRALKWVLITAIFCWFIAVAGLFTILGTSLYMTVTS